LSRNMKDSGIEWIGEVPEDWKLYRPYRVCKVIRGNCSFQKSDLSAEGDFVALQYGKTYKVDEVNNEYNFYVGESFFKEDQVVSNGDTILISTSETLEDLGHSCYYNREDVGLLGGEQMCLKPNNQFLRNKFLYYTTTFFNVELNQFATGLKVYRFKANDLKKINLIVPPIAEQFKISNFLDKKVAEIDHILEKTRESIEEYKKYKQSIITEAITKGLNPDVKMKDSGIEWIGEIPEHWKISKIKNLYEIVLGKMLCNERLSDDYTLENYLRAQNIKWDGINRENIKKMWFSKKEKEQYLLEKGDVVITEGGSVGVSAVYNGEESPCYIQNAVHRARGKSDNINKFLYYWMTLVVSGGYMDLICNKATIAHYTKEKLENTPISFCPVPEQISIIEYLDGKIKDFDNIIRQKEKLLIDLEAYKKSLIYECVTGKREVI